MNYGNHWSNQFGLCGQGNVEDMIIDDVFRLTKVLLGKSAPPFVLIHVKDENVISTFDDILISTVGWMLVRMWTQSRSI